MQAWGYCHRLIAENLAWGYNDASHVDELTRHRAKILRHGVAEYGIGKRGGYWMDGAEPIVLIF